MSLEPVALPEVTWTYRRWFAYGRTVLFSAMIMVLAFKIKDENTKRMIAQSLLGLLLADAVLYMVGPTATDVMQIFKAGLNVRRGPRKLP